MKKMIYIIALVALHTFNASAAEFSGNCAINVAKQALIDAFAGAVYATPDINISSVFDTKYQIKKSQLMTSYEGVIGYDEYMVELVEVVRAGGYPDGLIETSVLSYKVNPETCVAEEIMEEDEE